MAYVITSACVDHMDQSCVAACPVDCIHAETGVDRKFHVDPDGCIECGACASVCPNDAIGSVAELGAQATPFIALDALWFRDRAAARQRLAELLAPAKAA